MKQKLTVRKALELTRDMWRELAETGGDSKFKTQIGRQNPDMRNDCACCQYVMENDEEIEEGDGMDCAIADSERGRAMLSKCPMRALWPNGCEASGSPWETWVESDESSDLTRKRAAEEIANAAIYALAALPQEGGAK